MSSPPLPQPSCIDFEARKNERELINSSTPEAYVMCDVMGGGGGEDKGVACHLPFHHFLSPGLKV